MHSDFYIQYPGSGGRNVHRLVGFDSGSASLKPQHIQPLDAIAHRVMGNFVVNGIPARIQITGLHDSAGNPAHNAYLAGLRAIAAKNYLLSKLSGFPPSYVATRASTLNKDVSELGNPIHTKPKEYYDRAVELVIG